jgi:chemotaxis response regulator CheB
MTALVVITKDDGFASAAFALAGAELTVTRADVEDAVAVARQDHPDIIAIDADSIHEAKSLIGALSLLTRSVVVAVAHEAWPGSEAAGALRRAGADAVLPKPSGRASPTLAGADRDDYARWFADLGAAAREGPR